MENANEGLHILLNRLKSNPEDFDGIGGPNEWNTNKWSKLIAEVLNAQWFSEEEKQQINSALTQMRRTNFTRKVLVVLTEDSIDSPEVQRRKSAFGMVT